MCIQQRMDFLKIKTLQAYAERLEQMPHEPQALLEEMHNGVTRFFRDEEAFRAWGQRFFEKNNGLPLRIWSVGCSTGEEAYSLAILLQELSLTRAKIFATDIHGPSILSARRGVYSATVAQGISAARLQRFFRYEPQTGCYRVQKLIRNMLVFSEHDIMKDPPLCNMDGICCRNLLIYLNGEAQKKLILLFHYALRPQGILFLGSSESTGDFGDLFQVLDRKQRLYQRKESRNLATSQRFLEYLPELHRYKDIQDMQ